MKVSNIAFNVDDITLRGWLYIPDEAVEAKRPCIIMTHGFSALKEHGLDKFARLFCEHGMNVLIYDNRNFGESDGKPRLEVDPILQVRDMRNAITFAQSLDTVDENKIGLWGTSFSGGNVLVVGAMDKRIKCVVAQVPFTSGHHKALRLTRPDLWDKKRKQYNEDRKARLSGRDPEMIAVVTDDPEKPAIMRQYDAYKFFTSIPSWKNQVTLRSVENSGDYEPIAYIKQISPTPTLYIVAKEDTVNTTDTALKAYSKALEPKGLVMIDGDHFAPYDEEFDICSKAACSWFKQVLIENSLMPRIETSTDEKPVLMHARL